VTTFVEQRAQIFVSSPSPSSFPNSVFPSTCHVTVDGLRLLLIAVQPESNFQHDGGNEAQLRIATVGLDLHSK
jgi:hypothetical protein